MVVTRLAASGPGLLPDRDAAQTARIIWDAQARQRLQLHQGRRCPAVRSPLLRRLDGAHCVDCDELALDAQERLVVAWRRDGAAAWTPARVASCARSVLPDRVRSRLSRAGLVARPERWLTQRSFLPAAAPAGRILLVALVVTAGYYTRVTTVGAAVRPDADVVEALLRGLRDGGFARALTVAWDRSGADGDGSPTHRCTVADATDALGRALVCWQQERPELHAALVALLETNRAMLDPLGTEAFSGLAEQASADAFERQEWTSTTGEVAMTGRDERSADVGADALPAGQAAPDQPDPVAELLDAFVAQVRLAAGKPGARPVTGLDSAWLRSVLLAEADRLGSRPGAPGWLPLLHSLPGVVTDLIAEAAALVGASAGLPPLVGAA